MLENYRRRKAIKEEKMVQAEPCRRTRAHPRIGP
jgi:hypothetical protein